MRVPARRTLLLLVVLTGLAFALRVYHLDYQSLWRDEVDALRFALRPWPEVLATFRRPGENGPLFFLLLRLWLQVAGQSEFALRYPAACAGTAAVPVTYVLMRRLAAGVGRPGDARRAGLLAAAIMATAPYLVWYGQDAKMYALLTALVPLTFLLVVGLARWGGWWRWLLLYALTGVSFYVHVLAALAVPMQAVWLLMLPTGSPDLVRRRRLAALAYCAALVLPYLPLAAWQYQSLLTPPQRLGQPVVGLAGIAQVLVAAFSHGILPGSRLAALPVLLALLAGFLLWPWPRLRLAAAPPLGVVTSGEESDARPGPGVLRRLWSETPGLRTALLLAGWLVVPPIEIYLVSLYVPLFLDRYLIWVMPAFVALVACGIVALRRLGRPLGLAVLGAVIAVNLTAVAAQTGEPIKADFRAAARFVLEHAQPGDILVFQIPYNRYNFSYYAGKNFDWLDGPFTNRGESESVVADWMARGTLGRRSAWLIESEAPLWDERGLTARWLANHGRITDQADFTRVRVTRYNLQK